MSSFLAPLYKAGNNYIHYNSVPLVSAPMSQNEVLKGMNDADKFQDEEGNQLAPHNIPRSSTVCRISSGIISI